MDTPLFNGHLGAFDTLSHFMLSLYISITNAISKNLPLSGTKWLPIMTYIHHPAHIDLFYYVTEC